MKKLLFALLLLVIAAIIFLLFFFKKDAANPYQKVSWGKFSASCAAEELPDDKFGKDFHKCDYSVPKEEIPVFDKVSFPWTSSFDSKKSLPLLGLSLIHI